jgi:hypothetical protein
MKRYIRSASTNAQLLNLEQDAMREVWEYIASTNPSAINTYDNGSCGNIDTDMLQYEGLFYMASMLAAEEANINNYYNNSVGMWTKVSRRPKGDPDYVSGKWRGKSIDTYDFVKSGSMYWYTSEGVYRSSDHWGKRIASCSWYIDEENARRTTGFIRWDDLKPKGTLFMWSEDFILSHPRIMDAYFKNIELSEYNYAPKGFTFTKPR